MTMRTTGYPARFQRGQRRDLPGVLAAAALEARCGRRGDRRRRPRAARAARDRSGTIPLPSLPVDSATSCSIHEPKRRDLGRQHQRQLVARRRSLAAAPSAAPSTTRRALGDRDRRRPRRRANVDRRVDAAAEVGPQQRRRDQPEVRQRRISPADVGRVDEHAAIVLLLGELAQARRRIGDGDETGARAARRRRRSASSVRCQKCRSNAWISIVPPDFDATMNSVCLPAISWSTLQHRRRIGVVEHVQRRPPARPPYDLAQNLGPQRAAAHPQQHDVREAGRRRPRRRTPRARRAWSASAPASAASRGGCLIDRLVDGVGREERGVGLPQRGRARLSFASRATSASVARRSGSGSASRWRPDADSSSAARRPADRADQRRSSTSMNDGDAVVQQPVADARQVESQRRELGDRALGAVEVVAQPRPPACRDRRRRPASRAAPCRRCRRPISAST